MIRVGVLGATGMVGQHYVALLQNHPWFEITLLAASEHSTGKGYREAVQEWFPKRPLEVDQELKDPQLSHECDLVFSCMGGGEELEESLAGAGVYVISHNASHRKKADVPVVLPEINAHHLGDRRLIAKPNCALQSYVLPLAPLRRFGIEEVIVTTLQSLSGAGKKAMGRSEVAAYIANEEEKCVDEPCKILERSFSISATCMRVPIPYGHYATVSVGFKRPPTREEILDAWENFPGLDLPTAPKKPLQVCDPLTLDEMAVSVGRLRPCNVLDWQFVGLSHNVIRGAAGGGVLCAEALLTQHFPASAVPFQDCGGLAACHAPI